LQCKIVNFLLLGGGQLRILTTMYYIFSRWIYGRMVYGSGQPYLYVSAEGKLCNFVAQQPSGVVINE